MNRPDQTTAMSDTERDESVGQTLGRYKLLEKLGEGGCGVVYVAEQTEPVRRRVALKVIKLGMDTKAVVARFEAERQALAMMDHPNIAKVLDAGTTETGRPYFVMELVRGIRITEYADQNHLATKDRLDLFVKVCQAIQHAHQKGIIHRDIKPSNILVTLHDGTPVPKVIDFGIAKAIEGRLVESTIYTQLHQFIGTPAYMSPEQAEMSGLDIDTRSDIYSLGVLLYELLTGRTPFDAQELGSMGIDAMRKTIREKEPERPSTKLATLDGEERTTTAKRHAIEMPRLIHQLKGDLDWIAMKCLEKDRTRRYETANGLAADLKRHLNHEPVVARPPSAAYRFQKAFRRNKLVFASGSAIALALLAALAFSSWSLVRERKAFLGEQAQRKEAEAQRKIAQTAQAETTNQRDLAQDRLLDSLLREMRSIAAIRPAGYRALLRDRVHQGLELPRSSQRRDEFRAAYGQALGDRLSVDPVFYEWGTNKNGDITMALTADGDLAAAWTSWSGLELVDTVAAKRVASLDFDGWWPQLAFSSDGRTLFVLPLDPQGWTNNGSRDVKEWRRAGGAWLPRALPGAPARALAMLSAPEGQFALQFGASNELQIVNLETEKLVASLPFPGGRRPRAVAIAPARGLVAIGRNVGNSGLSSTVEIWSLNPPRVVARVTATPGLGGVAQAKFSADGAFLACTGESGVAVYETTEFKPIIRTFVDTGITIYFGATFLGDGTTVALPLSQDAGVRLLNLKSGDQTRIKTRAGVSSLESSLDGTTLVAREESALMFIRIGDTAERRRFPGHVGGVAAVEFSPDGHLLASTGKDGSVRLWDADRGVARRTIQRPNATGQTVAFSPDGQWLATADYQHDQVVVWSVATGEQVLALGEARAGTGRSWSCLFTPDGKHLVQLGANGLRVWELTRGPTNAPLAAHLQLKQSGSFRNLILSPDGQLMAFSGLYTHGIFLRGFGPEEVLQPLPIPLTTLVQSLGVVPNTGEFIQADPESPRCPLNFWNPVTHKISRTVLALEPGEHQTGSPMNLAVSPDSSRLAIANHEGTRVNIYDLASGRRLYSLPNEPGAIWWLAWHPNNRRLAVSRDNGDISVWSLPEVEATLASAGLAP
jgi:serine/threonine protein kinase/WD40 repeat protein